MNNKIQYRRYTPVGEALRAMLKFYGLAPELDRRRIYAAWDDASGAGPYTIRKYFNISENTSRTAGSMSP